MPPRTPRYMQKTTASRYHQKESEEQRARIMLNYSKYGSSGFGATGHETSYVFADLTKKLHGKVQEKDDHANMKAYLQGSTRQMTMEIAELTGAVSPEAVKQMKKSLKSNKKKKKKTTKSPGQGNTGNNQAARLYNTRARLKLKAPEDFRGHIHGESKNWEALYASKGKTDGLTSLENVVNFGEELEHLDVADKGVDIRKRGQIINRKKWKEELARLRRVRGKLQHRLGLLDLERQKAHVGIGAGWHDFFGGHTREHHKPHVDPHEKTRAAQRDKFMMHRKHRLRRYGRKAEDVPHARGDTAEEIRPLSEIVELPYAQSTTRGVETRLMDAEEELKMVNDQLLHVSRDLKDVRMGLSKRGAELSKRHNETKVLREIVRSLMALPTPGDGQYMSLGNEGDLALEEFGSDSSLLPARPGASAGGKPHARLPGSPPSARRSSRAPMAPLTLRDQLSIHQCHQLPKIQATIRTAIKASAEGKKLTLDAWVEHEMIKAKELMHFMSENKANEATLELLYEDFAQKTVDICPTLTDSEIWDLMVYLDPGATGKCQWRHLLAFLLMDLSELTKDKKLQAEHELGHFEEETENFKRLKVEKTKLKHWVEIGHEETEEGFGGYGHGHDRALDEEMVGEEIAVDMEDAIEHHRL